MEIVLRNPGLTASPLKGGETRVAFVSACNWCIANAGLAWDWDALARNPGFAREEVLAKRGSSADGAFFAALSAHPALRMRLVRERPDAPWFLRWGCAGSAPNLGSLQSACPGASSLANTATLSQQA